MRVRGDAQTPLMCLVGDRGEFLFRYLQLARLGIARKNAAGRAHLDHLGAIFALAADLIAKFVGRITDPLFLAVLLFETGRQEGAVAMPARRAECIARRHDPRPDGVTRIDCFLEPDIVAVVRADVADGGEARFQHGARIRRAHYGPEAVGEDEAVVAAVNGGTVQVDMHVDEAGHERHAGQVDAFRVCRDARTTGYGDNTPVGDHHHRVLHHPSGNDIDHAVCGDDNGFRLRRA